MSRGDCRLLERIEAFRDGRLDDAEAASVASHLAACDACSEHLRRLDLLQEQLSELPGRLADDAHAAHGRERLLAAATREPPVDPIASPWLGAGTLALLAGSALVAALFALFLRSERDDGQLAESGELGATRAAASLVVSEIQAGPGARWSKRWEAEEREEQVKLDEGELLVKVVSREQGAHFCVELPDGEIEDFGTTFVVRVEKGRTRYVAVSEGKVVLSLEGRPEITLGPGEFWQAEAGAP